MGQYVKLLAWCLAHSKHSGNVLFLFFDKVVIP